MRPVVSPLGGTAGQPQGLCRMSCDFHYIFVTFCADLCGDQWADLCRSMNWSFQINELIFADQWADLCGSMSWSLQINELIFVDQWAYLCRSMSLSLRINELIFADQWADLCGSMSWSLLINELIFADQWAYLCGSVAILQKVNDTWCTSLLCCGIIRSTHLVASVFVTLLNQADDVEIAHVVHICILLVAFQVITLSSQVNLICWLDIATKIREELVKDTELNTFKTLFMYM